MSVRSRIEAIEALSKDNNNNNDPPQKKRFQYPGPNRRGTNGDNNQPASIFTSGKPAKTQGLTDFESDLQEVWSVRKNIRHQGGTSGSNARHQGGTSAALTHSSSTAAHYSRHGAIAAQQSCSSPVLPKIHKDPVAKSHVNGTTTNDDNDEFSFESKRTPLQEQQSPWNVKKTSYSYKSPELGANKRRSESPGVTNGVASPPIAKRKPPNVGEANIVRPTRANDLMFPSRRKPDEKVNYAKKMANSYMRSVGIGEYTPKKPSPNDTQKQSPPHWKNNSRF